MTKLIRILHLHSTFSLGGKEARAAQLMNKMGPRAEHVILSAVPDALAARDAIAAEIKVDFPGDQLAPPLHGKPAPFRYLMLARYMQNFDLVLTYNWGAMDGVMARRLLSPFMTLPPLIHHEDGFNADETVKRSWKRNAFRRLALPTAEALVVPSSLLVEIAETEWAASSKVRLIRNGIDTAAYCGAPVSAIAGLEKQEDMPVVGTVAGLRQVKALPRLVRAVAALDSPVQLVIVGEGPERATIVTEAERLGIANRLIMPGFMTHPHRWIGNFDILALSSLSEQAPIAVLEAMAAGLPIVSFKVGDVAAMVAEENSPFIVADEAAMTAALAKLTGDPLLCRTVGEANRVKAAARFDQAGMFASYDQLYASAIGGHSLFFG